MNKAYEDKFKRKILQLHLEAGRSIASLAREYNVCHSTIVYGVNNLEKNVN